MPPSLHFYRLKFIAFVVVTIVFIPLFICVGLFLASSDKRSTFYVHNGETASITDIVLQSGDEIIRANRIMTNDVMMLRANLKNSTQLSFSFTDRNGKLSKSSMLYKKQAKVDESVCINVEQDGQVRWTTLCD